MRSTSWKRRQRLKYSNLTNVVPLHQPSGRSAEGIWGWRGSSAGSRKCKQEVRWRGKWDTILKQKDLFHYSRHAISLQNVSSVLAWSQTVKEGMRRSVRLTEEIWRGGGGAHEVFVWLMEDWRIVSLSCFFITSLNLKLFIFMSGKNTSWFPVAPGNRNNTITKQK